MRATTDRDGPVRSVDTRTRAVGGSAPVDTATFWATEWPRALERNGARAASDAERLDLPPLGIAVDGDVRTLRRGDGTLEAVAGRDPTAPLVSLDADAFADLVHGQRRLRQERAAIGDPTSTTSVASGTGADRTALS